MQEQKSYLMPFISFPHKDIGLIFLAPPIGCVKKEFLKNNYKKITGSTIL